MKLIKNLKMMSMKNKILQEIETRKEIYKTSPADMISAFNREIETEKEYNGRQLLELLQNADDEKSDEVKIELNTDEKILTIANRGTSCIPFSFDGIRSLMISNLSSKTTKKFIGNKGLGFRSIINWSEKISINSNGLDITFSRDTVEQVYDELFTDEEHIRIVKERNLPDSIKPIPFLSIPSIAEFQEGDWKTVVIIKYKSSFENDIKYQIDSLKAEILLFLNSIQNLKVIVDGEVVQDINKDVLHDRWKIYSKRGLLPQDSDKKNEPEYYELKIALQEDLRCDVRELFAFFPTKIEINFPYIVHGTFELNSSRNEIIDSEKNKYILKELVGLIVDTAKTITHEEVSYKALEMLMYSNPHKILSDLGFYEAIDKAIEELEIFPCIDGNYRRKEEAVFANELAIFIQRTQHEDLFPHLLIPEYTTVNLEACVPNNEIDDTQLEKLSRKIKNIDERVDFIYVLSNYSIGNKLPFLVDEKNELIELQDDVFTPAQTKLDLPNFVHIKFIHNELFKKLIGKFNITAENRSRALLDKLKVWTNIQEYAFIPVVRKIVTSTKKELENNVFKKDDVIKALVASMYNNYKTLDKKVDLPSDLHIPLLSKNMSVENAEDLYLSQSYPSGELTEYLFGDIFPKNEFLTDLADYELNIEIDKEDIELFFLWLGVNKISKQIPASQVERQTYCRKFFKDVEGKPDYADHMTLPATKKIYNLETIAKNISLEKYILWCIKDPHIYESFDGQEQIELRGSRGGHINTRSLKVSYIHYQLISLGLFENYLISNEALNTYINKNIFNFDDGAFDRYGVTKPDIESMMLKVGAVDKFEKLTIERVREIVKELPEKSPDGKNTSKIYTLCIRHFEKNKQTLSSNGIKLYASKNGKLGYYLAEDVYYNGNTKLPKKITYTIPILNYPHRQSTPNVIGFFGIQNLNTLKIEVLQQNVLEEQTNRFNKIFEQLKPFILTYMIKDAESDNTIREKVSDLHRINIKLCSSVRYIVNDEIDELLDSDYIKNESEYLIKISEQADVEQLRKGEVDFQESFADIIGLAFDIRDTHVYRDILIKEDIGYIERIVRSDIGYDELIRARRLLGISDEYYSFWATVYDLLQKDYSFTDTEKLLNLIKDDLKLTTDVNEIDYNHLDTYQSAKTIKNLFSELNLSIENFNHSSFSYYKIDFSQFHRYHIKEAFENTLLEFKKKLYTWSLEHSKERDFLRNIAIYEKSDDYILEKAFESKNALDVNYDEVVQYFINHRFDFNNVTPTETDFETVRDNNEQRIEVGDLKGDIELLSLLYFDNSLEKLQKSLQDTKETVSAGDNIKQQDETVEITDVKLSDIPQTSSSPTISTRSPSPYIHPGDNGSAIKGERAERIAYKALVEKYGKDNVFRKSNEDDSSGYDLKYRDGNGQWKYVEVKTYSGNRFYLTRNEKEFADCYKDQYEIFLVGEKVFRIKDVDYSDTSIFKLTAKEFIVEYSI
jgi:hypothetical protein